MEHSQSITPENIQQFRAAYASNTVSRVATKAASKCAVNDICYDTQHAKLMNHKFSVNVPTMSALNQKQSGRCWIFSSMNILREKVAKELNLDSFELSQSFISFYDHLEKANSFLEHVMESAAQPIDDRYVSHILASPVGDGGWWEFFVGLCSKYGVCPKESMPET